MNKEQIYDSQIHPLLGPIIEICKANKIAMLATFAIPTPDDDDLYCTSRTPDETGKLPSLIAKASSLILTERTATMMLTAQQHSRPYYDSDLLDE